MQLIKYTLILTALLLGVTVSCKKTDSDGKDDKASLLANKRWQVVNEYVRDTMGDIGNDVWSWEPGYVKDDYRIWHSDGSYLYSDNLSLMPGGTSATIDSGSWSLDSSYINMTTRILPANPAPFFISTISAGNMTIEVVKSKTDDRIYKLIQVP